MASEIKEWYGAFMSVLEKTENGFLQNIFFFYPTEERIGEKINVQVN